MSDHLKINKKIIGGGIIFVTLSSPNNQLLFLLGRENKYCINGSGKYCDFGGGNDGENIIDNVSREASEEIMGYFGNKNDIKKMFDKNGYCYVDNEHNNKVYRIYFLPVHYCKTNDIVNYFNNSQKILQAYLPKNILKKSKIFEKDKIEWFSIDDLIKRKDELRKFFKITSQKIIDKKDDIIDFINKNTKKTKNNKNNKTTTRRNKYINNKSSSSKKLSATKKIRFHN
jgi:hypothetical protein